MKNCNALEFSKTVLSVTMTGFRWLGLQGDEFTCKVALLRKWRNW